MKPYRVPEMAQKYFQYDMIQNYTELPPFPDARVHLLYIFLHQYAKTEQGRDELYALVVSLVQVGLDTHESIDTYSGNQGESLMRTRQLKVLAGDYFSSRFYSLLAEKGDIHAISLLSRAVSDVNVMKMNLYSKMKGMLLTAEEYLRHMVQLNMQLFLSFTPMLDSKVYEVWKSLLQEVTSCETILREAERSGCVEEALHSYTYWYILDRGSEEEKNQLIGKTIDEKEWKKLALKYKTAENLREKLCQSIEAIRVQIEGVGSDESHIHLKDLLEPFLQRLQEQRQAVREG